MMSSWKFIIKFPDCLSVFYLLAWIYVEETGVAKAPRRWCRRSLACGNVSHLQSLLHDYCCRYYAVPLQFYRSECVISNQLVFNFETAAVVAMHNIFLWLVCFTVEIGVGCQTEAS